LIAVTIATDLVTIVPSYVVAGDDRVRARPLRGLRLRIPVWCAHLAGERREEVPALVTRLGKVRPTLERASRIGADARRALQK
jgi:hypothetical protein